MEIWVKICGITRVEDGLAAAEAGADAVGFVFAASRRRVTPEAARQMRQALPRGVEAVGVFVDATSAEAREVAAFVPLTRVQLHGMQPPEQGDAPGCVDIIRAIRVASLDDLTAAEAYPEALILLDSAGGSAMGGTGETFAWEYAVEIARRRRIILAGGLRPSNVAEAIRVVRPWGVDVSTGVESAPGVKDLSKMVEFIVEARRAAGLFPAREPMESGPR